MNISIKDCHYVQAIVEEGSLLKAAAKMGVSQPLLSQQIKKIEQQLSYNIFQRVGRRIVLTIEGEIFYQKVVAVNYTFQELTINPAAYTEENPGKIRQNEISFGVIPTIAPYIIQSTLQPFSKNFSQVQIKMRELKSAQLVQALIKKEISFAIVGDLALQPIAFHPIKHYHLLQEDLVLAVHQQHLLAQLTELNDMNKINQQELIHLNQGHCLFSKTKQICQPKLDPQLQCDQLETALNMVHHKMGVAIVPRIATNHYRHMDNIKYIKLAKQYRREIYLLTHQDEELSEAAQQLVAYFIK